MSGSVAVWISSASSCTWNDADRFRMAPTDCRATTARVTNERPLRTRSTSNRTGWVWSPRRMKYACSEWGRNWGSTVLAAACSAWATIWPP